MNFTAILLLAGCLQVSATVHSQAITLHVKNAPLDEVFREIKKQTGYTFIYTETMLKEAKNVNIEVTNTSLQEALTLCFTNQPFTYVIIQKTVVLQPKVIVADNTRSITALPPPVEIHGRVVNQEGQPLQNVSVLIARTKIGTTTDTDGRFTLHAPNNNNLVLEISSVGYQTKRVNVGKQTQINVVLEVEVSGLSDVVVVGYGTQKRSDLTGSISSIKSKDLMQDKKISFLELLQGKMAGVEIKNQSGEPGAGIDIKIRGANSVYGSSNPLFVIDGIGIYV